MSSFQKSPKLQDLLKNVSWFVPRNIDVYLYAEQIIKYNNDYYLSLTQWVSLEPVTRNTNNIRVCVRNNKPYFDEDDWHFINVFSRGKNQPPDQSYIKIEFREFEFVGKHKLDRIKE